MKSDRKMPSPVSETRKIRKPLMEKKRRARINDSLETLKQILLDSKTTLKEPGKKSGQRTAKLEKADILEMTVHYIQNLKNKVNSLPNETLISKEGQKTDSSCDRLKMGLTLVPTRLDNGELAFVIPSSGLDKEDFEQKQDMWRPW